MDELDLKKKKTAAWIKILIGVSALIVIFFALRVFGVIQWYRVSGMSNMPALGEGEQVFATNS